LAGYIVPRHETALNVSEIREFLSNKLPDYMVPASFKFMQSLPLTNGKLNRLALPKPDKRRPDLKEAYAAPRDIIERSLSEIWGEVLQLDEVGIHDNFFDLGGHSLAATRVISQVIKQFQLELPLQLLFQSPTVAEMAAVIAEHQSKN
jgi:acyl carrier protein